jgi:hypothetical protein
VKFDYMTTAEEDEKYLTAEEISILLMCKYDQITTPGMRITSKDLGLYPQKHINTTSDKGVHPSLGLHLLVQLAMDHYY